MNYYESQPDFLYKDELKNMIIRKESINDIIKYLNEKNLSIRSYLKIKNNVYAPLSYLISHYKEYYKLFLFLLKNNVNITDKIDIINNEKIFIPSILITCDEVYIKHYIKMIDITIEDINYAISNQLLKRLKILNIDIKYFLNISNIKESLNNHIILLKKICITYNVNYLIEEEKNKYINFLIEILKYETVKFDNEFIQICYDWYIYYVLKIINNNNNTNNIINKEKFELKHYETMEKEKVAFFRQLFNDFTYSEMETIIKEM